jgi:predicted nucleic acid-binding protein
MSQGFADTSFFVAFLNARDVDHAKAVEIVKNYQGRIVTTDWVLAELGNFLSARASRNLFAPFVRDLPDDPRMEVLPADREQFESGCALYASRLDKDWSLTDCISMVVLQQRSIREVFTADHHFEQAGYTILMK